MPNDGDGRIDRVAKVRDYVDRQISECERDIRRLTLQLSVDRDYVESPEAEPGEIDYFRLQVQLQNLEVEFLTRRLAILREWQR
jgi:hypothetical protein